MRDLSIEEQRIVDALAAAFKDVDHDLLRGGSINAAPSREDTLRDMLQRGPEAWTPSEIDWLFFKAATTVGSAETVKYALARLIPLLLRDEIGGAMSDTAIVSKLRYADFATWPPHQRTAALDGLTALSKVWAAENPSSDLAAEVGKFIEQQQRD